MKKYLLIFLLMALPASALAQANSSNGSANGNAYGVEGSTATTQSQSQNENQNQGQNNNPGNGVETQSQSQVRTQSPTASTTHSPIQLRQNSSVENRSEVATAVSSLIQSSYQIENKGIGDQIRLIAQTHSENSQSINNSIDKVSSRSVLAKFFIGPNYKELGNARKLMDLNQSQIQNLEQNLAQISNDAEAQNLRIQIEILNEQQVSLQNDIDSFSKGFALFGWLNRLINSY